MTHQHTITAERDFYGSAGSGPLTISLYVDDVGEPDGVHIGWEAGGMYLTPYQARALSRFVNDLAKECGP